MAKKLPKVKSGEEVKPKAKQEPYYITVFKYQGASEFRVVLYPSAKHFETDWAKSINKPITDKAVYTINRQTGEITQV